MTRDQLDLLEQARDSIQAGKVVLDAGYPGFAASRTYYAMFYVAEAFLEGEGLSFSTHSAVIAAFGRHFARTGKVPAQFHKFLSDAQEMRHAGDYGRRGDVSFNEAHEQIARSSWNWRRN